MSAATVRQPRQAEPSAETTTAKQLLAEKLRCLCERAMAMQRRINEANATYKDKGDLADEMGALLDSDHHMKRGNQIHLQMPNGDVLIFERPKGGFKMFCDYDIKIKEKK